MSTRVTVYCDESGNDGPNYLNRATPFYVVAGWVVPEHSIVEATVAIELIRQKEFQKGTPELKYKLFDRNEHKRKSLVRLIDRLSELALTPVYVVAEKRYCVAGKIVETFLDPYYNELATNGFTWNIELKQEIANTLYDRLPSGVLEQFASAYRNPTKKGLADALTAVEDACLKCVNPELAKFMHGSHAKLEEIAEAEVHATETWGKAGGTINFPCLITFIMMIEQLGRRGLLVTDKIVHDEVSAYQDSYRDAFLHHKDLGEFWVTLPGSNLGHGSVLTVADFEVQRSVDQPLIQSADLLAGSINGLCIKLSEGKELTSYELEIAKFALTPMLFKEQKIAFPICSDQMLGRIGSAIRKCFPDIASGGETLPYKQPVPRRLPLLPALQQAAEAHSGRPVHHTPLPLYGIVTDEHERLIVLQYEQTDELLEADDIVVPLFTRKELAEEFLTEHQRQWDGDHSVRRFDVPEVRELLSRLEEMSGAVRAVEFDRRGLVELPEFISKLEEVVERVETAFRTGTNNVLVEHHDVDGIRIISVLLSSGRYGAMLGNDGEIFYGATRQEAVDEVRKGI